MRYRKHSSPPRVEWKKLLESTRHGDALYHPDVQGRRELLEMQCVRDGIDNGREILNDDGTRDHPNIREFWMDCGEVVDASWGRETTYVFAVWEYFADELNEVHGRPMTLDELRRRGVKP